MGKTGDVYKRQEDVRGFIPASKLSLEYVEDTEEYLNKPIQVQVIDVDKESLDAGINPLTSSTYAITPALVIPLTTTSRTAPVSYTHLDVYKRQPQ